MVNKVSEKEIDPSPDRPVREKSSASRVAKNLFGSRQCPAQSGSPSRNPEVQFPLVDGNRTQQKKPYPKSPSNPNLIKPKGE